MKSIVPIVTLLFLLVQNCQSQAKDDDVDPGVTIAVIDETPVYLHELIETYSRNQSENVIDRQELAEFLPSYINYRVKLLEGKRLGYHEDPEILSEFEMYAREAAYSYWLENHVKQDIIDRYKQRAEVEVKAFHILRELPANAPPADTAAAYQRMLEARNQLLNGAEPDLVNQEFSSQRNGNPVGGALPWITVGRTVPDFEEGLYSLEEGEISMPVRTQFGYHVIHLIEKRTRIPDRRISHIFFQPAGVDSVYENVQEAYQALLDGENWPEVADQFSMDRASAIRGGDIGWVGYAMQFPEPFVDEVMQADPEERFSKPLEMEYGYHIIRVDSVRTFSDDEEYNSHISEQLQRLNQLSPDREQVYEALQEIGELETDAGLLHQLSGRTEGNTAGSLNKTTLLTFMGQPYTVEDFLAYAEENPPGDTTGIINMQLFNDFQRDILRSYLVDLTRENFPEYDLEMDEFLNGLIVFRVNEEYIWNHERFNTEELQQYYQTHINRYQNERQFTYYRISSVNDTTLLEARELILEGANPSEISGQLEDLQVRYDSTRNRSATAYPVLEQMQPGELSERENAGSLTWFYYLEHIEEPRAMTFEEAFNRIASDYQPIREEAFLEELKTKYNVVIHPEDI